MKTLVADKVGISNILSIEDMELELGGVTVIEGPSNIGKSNFPRGIELIATGEDVEGLRRVGTSESSMVLGPISYDGKSYTAKTEIGEEEELTREEARKILGVKQVVLDKDLWICPQIKAPMSPPFLVMEYPPVAAKFIAYLSNLNPVLVAQREANRQLSNLYKERASIAKAEDALGTQYTNLSGVTDRLRKAENLKEEWKDLEALMKKSLAIDEALTAFREAFKKAEEGQEKLKRLKKLQVPELGNLRELLETRDAIEEALEAVVDAEEDLKNSEEGLEEDTRNLARLEAKLAKAVKAGSPCPYSGFALPKECVEGITK